MKKCRIIWTVRKYIRLLKQEKINVIREIAFYLLLYTETKGETAIELYELNGRTALDWQRELIDDILTVNDASK